ncbi:MAG: HD domain-containing protein [Acidobacteria bacterium]|nr:HD domain-containing protein [Acidobacteriota bacterium]
MPHHLRVGCNGPERRPIPGTPFGQQQPFGFESHSLTHRLHAKQKRKTSGTPYVCHLLGVAALVIEDGGTEDEAIAALLHDALEDQSRGYPGGEPALRTGIEQRFGAAVLHLVHELTERPKAQEKAFPDKTARWRAHKEGYIEQILTADTSVRRISCADSLFNVRSMIKDYQRMGDRIWERFLTRSRDDQLWAYHLIAQAFLARDDSPLARELVREIAALHQICGVVPG